MMRHEPQTNPASMPRLDLDELITDCAQRSHDLIRQSLRSHLSKKDCQQLARSLNAEATFVNAHKVKLARP